MILVRAVLAECMDGNQIAQGVKRGIGREKVKTAAEAVVFSVVEEKIGQ